VLCHLDLANKNVLIFVKFDLKLFILVRRIIIYYFDIFFCFSKCKNLIMIITFYIACNFKFIDNLKNTSILTPVTTVNVRHSNSKITNAFMHVFVF